MKAIRAWHISANYYRKLLAEELGLSIKELSEISPYPTGSAFDCTNRLTAMREKFASLGYEEAISKTDERFLAEHCGMKTQEAWETFWTSYCKNHDVPPYPSDAL